METQVFLLSSWSNCRNLELSLPWIFGEFEIKPKDQSHVVSNERFPHTARNTFSPSELRGIPDDDFGTE